VGYAKSGTNYRTIQKAAIGGGVQGQEGPGMQYNCSNIYDNVTHGHNLSKHIGKPLWTPWNAGVPQKNLPGARYQVPGSRYPAPGFRYFWEKPGTWHLVCEPWHLISSTWHLAPSTGSSWFQAAGVWYQVPGARHQECKMCQHRWAQNE
jgi:hypothetical protein